MTGLDSRRCISSGLRLLAESGEMMVRVAKPKYGELGAPERSENTARTDWGRYDSPGRTLYVAGDWETAYAEVLSSFKRQIGAIDPLERDAAAMGLTRDEFLELVAMEWSEKSFMGLGAVPRQWRADRSLYRIYNQGAGWLVDVEHPDTISALELELQDLLAAEGIPALTTAILRGENRVVTTAVGGLLRGMKLDDGSSPIGLQFGSKFGGGWCRALWVPSGDQTQVTDLTVLSGEAILLSDENLARACERFRIRVF